MVHHPVRRLRSLVSRHWRRVVKVVLATVVVTGGVFVWHFSNPHSARADSVEPVEKNPTVVVSRLDGGGYRLAPVDSDSRVGLVFYPTGRVAPEAYLTVLAPLAARADVTVFVVKPTLNLAALDADAAEPVIESHPGIDRWYVGGHSLGGAMACRFAVNETGTVEGVVLFASYCDRDLGETGLDALSVTGGADGVLDRNSYRANRVNLPRDATEVEIPGMNHSQFGDYTGQQGGVPANVSYAEAHRRLAEVLVGWFERGRSGDGEDGHSDGGSAHDTSPVVAASRRPEAADTTVAGSEESLLTVTW